MSGRSDLVADCWPTARQEDLLAAALLDGPPGLEAWARWRAAPEAGPPALRLLPLLLHNLRRHGVVDPLVPLLERRVAPVARHSARLGRLLAQVLSACERQSIPTLLLKGAGLAAADYPAPELRPLGDADLLVPAAQLPAAAEVLLRLDLHPATPLPASPAELAQRHAVSFRPGAGGAGAIDLHWHALDLCCGPQADAAFWSASRPATWLDRPTRVLSAPDQLLHACVHGLRWSAIPPQRWVADAVVLLRRAGAGFDWPRVLEQARERRLVAPLRAALGYLQSRFDVVPAAIAREWEGLPVAWPDARAFDARVHAPWLRGPLRALALHADEYRRGRQSGALAAGLEGLACLGRLTWGARGVWDLPLLAASRGGARALELARWRTRGTALSSRQRAWRGR